MLNLSDDVAISAQLTSWCEFYAREFNITVRPPQLPVEQAGFNHLVLVAKNLGYPAVIERCQHHFGLYSSFGLDFDRTVSGDARIPTKTYIVMVQQPTTPVQTNVPSNDEDSERGITLLERLLLGLKHYVDTGVHLDPAIATLCKGSVTAGGQVPFVAGLLPLSQPHAQGGITIDLYTRGLTADWLQSQQVRA